VQPTKPFHYGFGLPRRHAVKRPNGEVVDVVYVPPCPKIQLAACGSSFEFSTDLFSDRQYSHLTPGRWKVVASNGAEELKSEPIEFDLVFSDEAVDDFLKLASDKQTDRLTREWARAWLRKVNADLPAEETRLLQFATAAEVAQAYAESMKRVSDFATWWKKHRCTESVRAAIDEVNHSYGLDPMQVRLDLMNLKSRIAPEPAKSK
jgi:hypothetical protein